MNAIAERDKRIIRTDDHLYIIDGDTDHPYTSVTTVWKKRFPSFDAIGIAEDLLKRKAPKYKEFKTAQEIVDSWDRRSELGTDLHANIEDLINEVKEPRPVSATNQQIVRRFADFWRLGQYSFIQTRCEWMVFDEESEIAGTIDFVGFLSETEVVVWDWKRVKDVYFSGFGGKKGIAEPCLDMDDCNFNKYMLQLHTYSNLLERKYGLKVLEVYIIVMHEDIDKIRKFGGLYDREGVYEEKCRFVFDQMTREVEARKSSAKRRKVEAGSEESPAQ